MKNMPQLIKYFYPCQIVSADPKHIIGDESLPATKMSINHGLIDDNQSQLAIDITLSLDKEKSTNASYDFELQIFGIFMISDDEKSNLDIVSNIGSQLLIGCLRERLSMLTQAGPWPEITLSIQYTGHFFNTDK